MVGYQGFVLGFLLLLQCWAPSVVASENATSDSQKDGLGLAYAESCQTKLFAYRNSSASYYSAQPSRTSYFTSSIVRQSYAPGTTSIASLTTLCDGYPRVVGSTIRIQGPPTNFTDVYTNTNLYQRSTGFAQPPCSIGPKDCELLYSSWTSAYKTATTAPGFAGLLAPPCTTSTRSVSYSTNSAGKECNNCQVAGSKARLLYWPMTTVPGSGDLCNKTAITIPGTRTADGPNTFVTAGVTITSPTIAVSIASLSRVDGCGTTIATTILPVNPDEVSSVRGNRALFTHMPFNFADLNWHCPDGEYVTDTGHHNCYQEFPAAAYFDGTEQWAGLDAMGIDWAMQKNLTIWNDYHPQLLPPQTMMDAIHSIYGNNCNIHPNGIWDPPIALQEVGSIEVPVYTPATPTESQQAPTTIAAPRTYTAEHATQTTDKGASASHEATAVPDGHPDQPDSGGSYLPNTSDPGSDNGGSPTGHDQPGSSVSNPPSPGGNDNSPEDNSVHGQGGSPSSQVVVIHSLTFTRQVQSNGAEVLTNAQPHFTIPSGTAGSAPVVVISQKTYTVSGASGNTAESGFYLVGDGTTHGFAHAPSNSQGSVQGPSGTATDDDDEDTTQPSDRRSGPSSTSSADNVVTTEGFREASQTAALQGPAVSVLSTSRSLLSSILSVAVLLTLQIG